MTAEAGWAVLGCVNVVNCQSKVERHSCGVESRVLDPRCAYLVEAMRLM